MLLTLDATRMPCNMETSKSNYVHAVLHNPSKDPFYHCGMIPTVCEVRLDCRIVARSEAAAAAKAKAVES